MNKLIIFFSMFLVISTLACSEEGAEVSESTAEEVDGDAPVFTPTPDAYAQAIEQAGSIEELNYSTQASDGNTINKTAYVYLPYQYDSTQQYDILYLMHGGDGNSATLMGNTSQSTALKYVFDNMIYQEEIRPLIIVTPTFYMGSRSYSGNLNELTHNFQTELREDLIPTVEERYSTYAQSSSPEDLISSRDHRAFSGFSMGGVTTWYTLSENLDYFHYFIPSSGDSWAIQQMGGSARAEETADFLANTIDRQGYAPNDFFIFAITGTGDFARDPLSGQIEALRTLSDNFIYDYDTANGNLYYLEVADGLHTYGWYNDYLYTVLPYFFGENH